ncbi:potassium channel family protein [Tunicatimonas pelagia]|uniref:potassium channel family protein n=1 Tax=Tunicatimonas pelagia TaxID=931531 RepID=UPI002666B109|nr:potassium channel protein [Tunicatimonas pelagia]WKN41987.1 potassium channel protein [Tunicatimonas pelagia]
MVYRAWKKYLGWSKELIFNRLSFGLLLLTASLIIGQIGYTLIEEYSTIDAFYMTVITLSTVGFTEVRELSDAGRIFTSFYIIFNLGIFAYAVGTITSYFVEGEFAELYRRYTIGRKVERLQDHVIVCGLGRNGSRTCEELQNSQHPFVVIELKPEIVEQYAVTDEIQYVIGDATTDEVLQAAGVERAEAIITTLPRDADNVFITLTARELNPNIKIIARATDERAEKKLHRAGADQVVMPDAIGGVHMARLITQPSVIEFLNILSGTGSNSLKLEDIMYDELQKLYQNKTLRELNIRQHTGATVIGFRHQSKRFTFNPHGDLKFEVGDTMIIVGTEQNLQAFRDYYT